MARFLCLSLVAVVLLLISFQQVFATLKCWQCDSDKNPDCGDPFNATKIAPSDYVECKAIKNMGPAYCIKAVVVKPSEHGDTRHVRRMCADAELKVNVECSYNNCTVQFCDKCNDDDGCNRASQYNSQYSPLAIIRIFVPIVLVKLFSR